jgi:hypothetical protein
MKKVGSRISIEFNNAEDLKTMDGRDPMAFEIAGADKVFKPASAVISDGGVLVWNDAINDPVAVRYAFTADPDVNLVNHDHLPVRPFRTDDWHVKGKRLIKKTLQAKSKLVHQYNPQQIASGEIEEWEWTGEGIDPAVFHESRIMRFFDGDKIQILVVGRRDLPEKRLRSPSFIWQKEIDLLEKGLTFQVNSQMFRANLPYRGFSLEVGLSDNAQMKIYRIDFTSMMVFAYRGEYTYILAYDIDNTGYHTYRLAIRDDGIAQVYFDHKLIGVVEPDVIEHTGHTGNRSYIRFGKLETEGDMTLNIQSVSFDPTGAFAPCETKTDQ